MKHSRAIALIVLALVVAFAATLVALRWIHAQTAPVSSKVAVANADLPLGTRLAPDMITLIDWPANALPPGAIGEPALLEARVTRHAIARGEPLLEGKLAPAGTLGGLSAALGDGKRAMTVRVNDVVGVAGFALPGNFVDVLVNTQGEPLKNGTAQGPAISKIVLERILVLAIAQEASRDDTKAKVVNAVTLELTPEQTEMLDLARSVGTLSLVLRNQVEDKPVNTDGATKSSLLDAKAASAVPAAKVTRRAAPQVVQARLPGPRVELIKGLERSAQHF